jgi:hypothetical protein
MGEVMGEHIDRLMVDLARVRVGRYLRKGEGGKIEDVSGYVRIQDILAVTKEWEKTTKDYTSRINAAPDAATKGKLHGELAKKQEAFGKKVADLKAQHEATRRLPRTESSVDQAAMKKADDVLKRAAAKAFEPGGGSTKAREDAARAYRKEHPSPKGTIDAPKKKGDWAKAGTPEYDKEVEEFRGMIQRSGGVKRASDYKTSKGNKPLAQPNPETVAKVKAQQDKLPSRFRTFVDDSVKTQKKKAPKRLTSEEVAANKKAGKTTKVYGYAGPKRSAKETKAILEKQHKGEYLGDDGGGNQIKVGNGASIKAGPDKGQSGTVVGRAKGGGIVVRIGSGVQAREVLVDPDELRMKRS